MSDEEIVKALAQRVKGYPSDLIQTGDGEGCRWWSEARRTYFDPLENDADACAVLDKMAMDGWHIGVDFGWHGENEPPWGCSFEREYPSYFQHRVRADDRRRAICLAAARALGVDA